MVASACLGNLAHLLNVGRVWELLGYDGRSDSLLLGLRLLIKEVFMSPAANKTYEHVQTVSVMQEGIDW